MHERIIEESKKFLMNYLNDKSIIYEENLPWRRDVKFIILHSLRVHAYALKLIPSDLTEEEKTIIEVASLLHDLGRAGDTRIDHAKLSSKLVKEWINHRISLFQMININRLLDVIETHSNKTEDNGDICSQILKDADLLDEIGILSIFMQSYKVDQSDPFFFHHLMNKIKKEELPYCLKTKKWLKTEKGKALLDEKIQFIESFIKQFENELLGTEDYYN